MLSKGFSENLSSSFVILFGIIGLLAPFISIVVATLGGKSEIGMINSTALMLLSVLIIIFLVIKAFSLFFNNHKKLFVIDLIFLILAIFSFIIHLLQFVTL